MRIVQVTAFGGPEVLVVGRAAEPVAGAGQVVVGVSVVDVLSLETQLRTGWGTEFFGQKPPYVPGGGVGGRVVSVGEGVDPGWVGRDVIAMTGDGGYAERVVVPLEALVPVPDELGVREATALLQIGPAALSLAGAAEVKPGERVLVTAAAGGLGTLLVQLAHAVGAHVIATARGGRKLDLARELGAEIVVDYSEPGWLERVREAAGGGRLPRVAGGAGVDVVFDGAGGRIGQDSFEVTARGGRFFTYGVPGGSSAQIDPGKAERRGVSVHGMEQVQFAPEKGRRLAGLALSEAAAGRIRPVIGQTFPLDRAADAHAAIEARDTVGKTLLLV
ncbi:zinc-binding dehydrogenase [Streptosporangium sp. NPDC000095]|uniref:zinc-binding dehydrogenase n=1 Tax=Streptosporangium sp. NPDC000095 TaxID=3366184 RepID=UPI0036C76A21